MSQRLFTTFLLAVLLAWTSPVSSHARLTRAQPAPGSVMTRTPTHVRLWFNEELDVPRSAVSVWNAQRKQVDAGKGGVDLNDLDRMSMVVRLKNLPSGGYTVRWRAVSADDLNIATGNFAFTFKPR